jgi:transcriptional regulator with XRE-family HTH domain
MSTSQSVGRFEPVGHDKISQGTLGYICARNRQRQYDVVIREFRANKITQKQLADRLGRGEDVISRWLARPRNWEADTFAELMFAISGAVPAYRSEYPFRRQAEETIYLRSANTQERQEDAKPDLVSLGLIKRPPPSAPKQGGNLSDQLAA